MAPGVPLSPRRNALTVVSLLLVTAIASVAGYLYVLFPVASAVEGPAAVPAPGQLLIRDRLVHLDGLMAPREDADCRVAGQVLQCALISQSHLIELTAGKTVRCDVKRYGDDERSWGRCHVKDPDPALFERGEDDLNRVLVRTGWAVADRQHFADYINDGQIARTERLGLWQGTVGERRVSTSILAGIPTVKDGDTIELMEVDIRLRGVDAPDIAQTCTLNGLPYACGIRSRASLVDLLAGLSIVCHVGQFEGDDRVWGRCGEDNGTRRDFANDSVTLNEAVVLTGWGFALADKDVTYTAAEAKARTEKRGMWAGQFVRPADWRKGAR